MMSDETSKISIVDLKEVGRIINSTKSLAKEYRILTGKPLGIVGEVAEYEAARLLKLQLTDARQPGFNALRLRDGNMEKIQIKGRCILPKSKLGRVPSIKFKHEWDFVLLVLVDENFGPMEILEASRKEIIEALVAPGSIARNERGSLAISQFKRIAKNKIWDREIHEIKYIETKLN
ncbi:MAG: hypothetical protein LH473_03035 [Chitinophagales bacterium]|nr:hypothetical protein [Chitinophagales bacterium]